MYDTLVFIGRFQPFHSGHKAVVDTALEKADKVAIVVGSHDQPRTTRNPFTSAERIEMISLIYPQEVASGRIHFIPQVDHTYNLDRWIAGVQVGVQRVATGLVGLIGHSKDNSSFYLKCFPMWESVEVPSFQGINATEIRNSWLDQGDVPIIVPTPIADYMQHNIPISVFSDLVSEKRFINQYKEQWASSPYTPTFNTVDAVVVQSGHVLLVRRRAAPGKGLWALPGGYINEHETLEESALRELREETRIDVPLPALKGSIVKKQVFDDPHRSQRGRIITTAFYIRLSDREELPRVKGGDDADKARWVPLSAVQRSQLFEDHYDILETMVSI